MIGVKRKYGEEEKIKSRRYYLINKDVIKERNKKYRERLKNGDRPASYTKNPTTKKAKKLRDRIAKINKKTKILKDKINKVNEKIKNLKKNDKKDLSFGLPQPNYTTDEQKISLELKNRVAKEIKNRTDKLEEKKNYFHYCRSEERELLRKEIREEEIKIKEILNNE